MIDRSLNFGRHIIAEYARSVAPYQAAVDLGAGAGGDLQTFRTACQSADLHGVEVNAENQAALGRAGVAVHPLDIEYDRLPFDDSTIDLVSLNQLLEHTKQVYWILHEISRTLRLGGHLIIGVPNLASFHNRILLAAGRQPTVIKTASAHVRGFTKPDLLGFLADGFPGGYELVALRGSNFYPFPPGIARRLADWFPTLAWGLFFLLRKQRPYTSSFLDFPIAQQLETNYFLGSPSRSSDVPDGPP